jgi:hypothetical protein
VDNWNENTTLVLDQVAAQNEQGLEELEKWAGGTPEDH